MNTEDFEKYNLFIRGKDASDIFPVAEQAELLLFGIQKKILIQPNQNSFELIKTIVTQSTDENLIHICLDDLVDLGHKKNTLAIECLFDLAIIYENKLAIERINQNQFISARNSTNACFYLLTHQIKKLYNLPRPLYTIQSYYRRATKDIQNRMVLAANKNTISDWHYTATCLNNISEVNLDDLLTTYNSFTRESKAFFLGQIIYHYLFHSKDILDVLLFLFFHTEESVLHSFLNTKLISGIPDQQFALFLLIDEQWQRVQLVDPGSKFLQQAYQEADNFMRLKILQKTRSAGIDLVFSDISKQQKLINLHDLSNFDWESILNSQISEEQLNTLWRLAQVAPPYWSSQILLILYHNHFIPQVQDEIPFFNSLISTLPVLPMAAKQSLLITEREHTIPGEYQFAVLNDSNGAFYSRTNDVIYLCDNLDVPKPIYKEIFPPKPLMPAIQFSHDANYLLWADVDQMVNVYEKTTDRIIKRFPAHKSIMRCLVLSKDQKHLFSASFDGTVQSWRFPDGFHEKEILNSRNEIYSMVLSDSGQYLICGDIVGTLRVISTDGLECIHEMSANHSPVIGMTQPHNQMIAAYNSTNEIMVWNYLSKRILNQFTLEKNLGICTKLLLTSDEKMVYQTTNNGNLNLLDSLSGTLYEHFSTVDSSILEIEQYGHSLWLFQKNGNARMLNISLWQLVLSPINQTGNHQLKKLDEIISLPQITTYQKKWLEFIKILVHWQKRFDISIEEIQTSINIDDFSITI